MANYYLVILGITVGLTLCAILAYNLYKKIMYWFRVIEMNRFKEFIKNKVILTFNEQRQGEGDDRFAVLMLASKASLWELSKMVFKCVHTSFLTILWLTLHFLPSLMRMRSTTISLPELITKKSTLRVSYLKDSMNLKQPTKEHCDKKLCSTHGNCLVHTVWMR